MVDMGGKGGGLGGEVVLWGRGEEMMKRKRVRWE